MPTKFLDNPYPEDRLKRRMVQHVETNKPNVDVLKFVIFALHMRHIHELILWFLFLTPRNSWGGISGGEWFPLTADDFRVFNPENLRFRFESSEGASSAPPFMTTLGRLRLPNPCRGVREIAPTVNCFHD